VATLTAHRPRWLLTLLVPCLGASLAHAEAGNPLTDRFSLSLGTFLLDTSTQLRIDGAAGNGTEFDAERVLGLRDSDRFRVDGYWRFANRHKLRLLYFDTKRSATRSIDTTLQVGDTVFPVDAELESSFDTRVAELAYEYTFLKRDNYEVAASFGIHDLKFELNMEATRSGSGEPLSLARAADANGPLPVLGLRGTWLLSKRFYLDAQVQFFKISIDPYDGRLEDYTISVVWQAFKHVGLGAGYNQFVTRLDVSDDRFDGSLRWKYDGARIFVIGSF
jgi:hypothetical protein